jgi:hypothetical protein
MFLLACRAPAEAPADTKSGDNASKQPQQQATPAAAAAPLDPALKAALLDSNRETGDRSSACL